MEGAGMPAKGRLLDDILTDLYLLCCSFVKNIQPKRDVVLTKSRHRGTFIYSIIGEIK